ncbi:hypothetical protein GCM10023325_20330 [Sphingomonas lutea]
MAGADVVERHDPARRGKGYALAYGRQALAVDAPPTIVIIDADCRVEPGGLARLAAEAFYGQTAVQAAYLLEQPSQADELVALSSFAFMVRNLVRQRGLARLGAAALLQGTGMAFPWRIFSAAPLATDDIVEDLNLGIALLHQGHRITWIENARVNSLPASRKATIAQRTRWEHGFVVSALTSVPRLLVTAILRRRLDMALFAIDLLVPPLALFAMLAVAAWVAAGLFAVTGGTAAPLAVLTSSLVVMVTGVLLAWVSEGRRVLSLKTLVKVPVYLLWKLPIYARLLVRRQHTWVRTERD